MNNNILETGKQENKQVIYSAHQNWILNRHGENIIQYFENIYGVPTIYQGLF